MAGHGHVLSSDADGPADAELVAPARVKILLVLLLLPVLAATGVGLVKLWPRADPSTYLPEPARFAAPGVVEVSGAVSEVRTFPCPDFAAPGEAQKPTAVCATVKVLVADGPDQGQTVEVNVASAVTAVGIVPGNAVHLFRLPAGEDQPVTYEFSDFDRHVPLAILAVVFALLVILVARLRGLLALAGLGVAFLILVKFVLPALLLGRNPLLVGLVGSAAILCVVLYLAHGVSIRTTTALVGTLFGMAIAAGLAFWAVDAASLTGAGSEEGLVVRSVADRVQLSGLLLTGIVIAGLGVLNDVTVTQASAVWELHALDAAASARRLFAGGMRIGRDHIASSVYTIAFAYAGSALPVLLLLLLYQRPFALSLTSEAVAEEVVSILVGAIALVLAVPLTTLVAVGLVKASAPRPVRVGARRRN